MAAKNSTVKCGYVIIITTVDGLRNMTDLVQWYLALLSSMDGNGTRESKTTAYLKTTSGWLGLALVFRVRVRLVGG